MKMVVNNGQQSTRSALNCGVPQGSMLGLIFLLLYTVNITAIAEYHELSAHSYEEGNQQILNLDPTIIDLSAWHYA